MLTLTETARAHLVQILDQTEAPSNMTIRFVPAKGNQLIVSLDYLRPGDTTFVHNGKVLLVLDTPTARALTQHTVDLLQGRNAEPRFVLRSQRTRRPVKTTAPEVSRKALKAGTP